MMFDRTVRLTVLSLLVLTAWPSLAQSPDDEHRVKVSASPLRPSQLTIAQAAQKADRPYGELEHLYARAAPKATEATTPDGLDALLGLGHVELVLGHKGKAEAVYDQLSRTLTRTSDPERYAQLLLGRAELAPAGAEGVALTSEAVSIAEETGNERQRVKALTKQAIAYLNVGSEGQAIIVAERAIQSARAQSLPDLLPAALVARAKPEFNIGKHDESVTDIEEALALVARYPESNVRSDATSLLAVLQAETQTGGTCGPAQATFRDALKVARDHDIGLRIPHIEVDLSECLDDDKAFDDSLDVAMDGWLDGYATDLPLFPRATNRHLGSILSARDRTAIGTLFTKRSVNALAVERINALSLPRTIRGDHWSHAVNYYDLVDSLVTQNRYSESERAMELMASDELLGIAPGESVHSPAFFEVPFTKAEGEQSKKLDGIVAKYVAATRQNLSKAELVIRRSRAKSAIRGIIEQGLTPSTPIEFTATDDAALHRVQNYLAQFQQPAALISFHLGRNSVTVQVSTKDESYAVTEEWARADRSKATDEFYAKVVDPHADPKPSAQVFYEKLIAPIRHRLDAAGIKNLLFFTGPALTKLPVAALFDGQHWLAEDFGIATYVPSATRDLQPDSGPWRVAAFGVDSSLPAVTRELDAIVETPGSARTSGILAGEIKLDSAFTAESLHSALDQRYPVIHIASHFLFDPDSDDSSYLVLGDNGRLLLKDIQKPAFDFSHVDLVTLSACDTGSAALSRYSNLVYGLGYVALDQGARSVLGTLWPVLDDSTADFMQDFYAVSQNHTGDRKIAALRAAQLAFIHAGHSKKYVQDAVRGLHPDGIHVEADSSVRRDYSHPYYWAGFSLIGDPR